MTTNFWPHNAPVQIVHNPSAAAVRGSLLFVRREMAALAADTAIEAWRSKHARIALAEIDRRLAELA